MIAKLRSPKTRITVITLLLAVAALAQTGILLQGFIPKLAQKIWEERSNPAIWRSASIHLGSDYAEYLAFVRSHVPEDGLLIIPKASQSWQFGNIGLMQHYLFPRRIADCPIDKLETCILNLKGSNTYILAPTGSFPPREIADQVKRFLPYGDDEKRGLYVPLP